MTVVAKNGCRFVAILFLLCWQHLAIAQVSAAFFASPFRSGCSPLVVNFTDSSTGNPTQWRWDLGNGVTSLLRNPSTTYFNPGSYTVKLVVRNAAGNADSVTKTNYITIYPNPVAAFTADKTTGCFPLPVSFTDASAAGMGSIASWMWDFGDGTTSTQQNPLHTYTTAGNYTVTLRVTNSMGCAKTITKAQYVTVAAGVTASFNNSNPGACAAPVTIAFSNTSAGPGLLAYEWSFGDGASSTAIHPSHTYTANGSYSVVLIVTSPQGCTDTVRKNNLVSLGNPKAGFTVPDTVCANEPIQLTNTSVPVPATNSWSFGDGSSSALQDPTHMYTATGVKTIKLLTDFGGCADSVSKTIFVAGKSQAQFTATTTAACSVPVTVNFTNQSTGSSSVVWYFGDGSFTTTNNPSHTYTAAGNYTVTAVASNAAGCSDTLTKTDFIQIQQPQVSLAGLPRSGCSPLTVSPLATISAGHNINNYLWKFGDGSTSTSATPSHTYTGTGTYNVTLVYTTGAGCTDSVTITSAVKVGTKPKSAFAIRPTDACAFQNVSFTDNSTGTVDNWQWSFGDGSGSTQQHPIHQYSDTGWFHVQLIVSNNTCSDTLRKMNAVHIKPPIANFVVAGDCNNKYTKSFIDRSLGATSWWWSFGDGATSTQRNPVHTYATTGTYSVTLTVSNDTCQHSATIAIKVVDEKARFTGDTIVCRNSTASFQTIGIQAANIRGWNWAFGDGSSSGADTAATHVYTTSGHYTVKLIITDIIGCTDTAVSFIKVFGPTADFSVSASVACLYNNSTTFTNSAFGDGLHPIVKWQWSFGDGVVDSSGPGPLTHSYATAGTYASSLMVRDDFGCTDIATKPAAVSIMQPKADFYSADTVTCTNKAVIFQNTSTGNGLQHTWSFGDGLASTAANPVHSYPNIGTYTVKLNITDQYGCKDSLSRADYIFISYPKARLAVSDTFSTCPPLLVDFTHKAKDYTALRWEFGDGTSSTLDSPSHFYTGAGIYYARLIATGPGGCADTAVQRIEIKGPSGSFSYAPLTGCKPLKVNFTAVAKDIATYTWDFADGNIFVTADSLISHTYTNAGDFMPKLILTDAGGCSVPIFGDDTVKVIGVSAGISIPNSRFCSEGTVQFANTTVGNDFISSYEWSFGDGSTSTDQNPWHHYTAPGVYTVSLTVISQSGCLDSLTYVDTVKVNPNPVISITHDSSGCVPVTVGFRGNVLTGDATAIKWTWDFGNGIADSVQTPSAQVYSLANGYHITALATDSNGCRDTATVTINAYPIPAVTAGQDVFICRGSFANLIANGAATYNWHASPTLSCTACASPLAVPTDSTQYVVTGTSEFGCTATDSVTIRVHQPFTLQVGTGDTVCAGTTVHLRATGADRYTWSPATAVANATTGITTANPMTTTAYKVIGRDNHNCFADSGEVFIRVWPYPTVNAGDDKTVGIGTSLTLQPAYSADITSYQWTNPMQSLSCTTCPSPTVHTKAVQNTYTIQVKNDGGCVSKDEITIYAICNGGNLFIPNTFSPNGDGKNDEFHLRGSGVRKIKSLRVYNRWGETVFSSINTDVNDALSGWNGSYKGEPLPPDVYVYTCEVVCMNNEVLTYNGNVTLLR